MAEVRVRNLDDYVVGELKERAKRHGHSMESELRKLITNEVLRPRRDLMSRLEIFREEIRTESGLLSDSTEGIRADRDLRG